MTQEQYVSYEVAKLLHEKGFEINPELDYWKIGPDGHMYFMCSIGAYTSAGDNKTAYYRPKDSYPCPTQQMAMRWLREEKYTLIFMVPAKDESGNLTYAADVWTWNEREGLYEPTWCTNDYVYEKACEAAIKYCLEHLIE